ncbi:hypothetical protein V1511DRAFT_339234 [Dipodascopsis uninucleata]
MPKKPSVPVRSLMRGLVRASWHKQNLYNIFKKEYVPRFASLYKQKWEAKRETRAYHGDFLTEHQWQGLFSKRLGGAETVSRDAEDKGANEEEPLPLGLQLYAPLERRLDVAMFRAMFASSPKQARQFIAAGDVKVNGIKMRYPSYQLKPGEVFSVDPESVMYALGRSKPSEELSAKVDKYQLRKFRSFLESAKKDPRRMFNQKFEPLSIDGRYDSNELFLSLQKRASGRLQEKIQNLKQLTAEEIDAKIPEELKSIKKGKESSSNKKVLDLKARAYDMMEKEELLSVKDFATVSISDELKNLVKEVIEARNDAQIDDYEKLLLVFKKPSSVFDNKWYYPYLEEYSGSKMPWQDCPYGLQNPSKKYFTPWTPRTFLAPFAIVPSHLEISFRTCHAVYLRDPIARRGQSEVISPLPLNMHEQAFLFYVRNRM